MEAEEWKVDAHDCHVASVELTNMLFGPWPADRRWFALQDIIRQRLEATMSRRQTERQIEKLDQHLKKLGGECQ